MDELVGAVKPGQPVSIQGAREQDWVVKADVITNSRTGRSVTEHEPSWRDRPMPPHLTRFSMTDMQARGSIQTRLYAPRGEVRGFNGTQIHLRPDVGDSMALTLTIGDTIQVEGYGTENRYGRSLKATAICFSGGRLIPLDRSGGHPAGPDALPPPRRR